MLGDVFGSAYPTWTFGVTIGYPLGANTAHANLARVRLEYEQAQAQLKNMEMQVATQVRTAGAQRADQPEAGRSRRARRASCRRRSSRPKRRSSRPACRRPFFVFQAQRDLALARTAEIQAISDYNKSLVDFEAVQQVPLNGDAAHCRDSRARRR